MSMELVRIDEEPKQETNCSDLLEHYKIVALTLYKAHKDCALRSGAIAVGYNIFTILMTSITGSASLSLLFEEYQSLKILNVVLSYLVVALGTMYRYYTPDKLKEKHRFSAEEYIRLYYHVVEILVFDEITIDIIKDVNKQLEELRESSPYITDDLYDKYKQICGNMYKKHKRVVT